MLVIESCVGINDGIKPRIGIIKLFKTTGYRTYSDGVGATKCLLDNDEEPIDRFKRGAV